ILFYKGVKIYSFGYIRVKMLVFKRCLQYNQTLPFAGCFSIECADPQAINIDLTAYFTILLIAAIP
ncbi:MAG TPA: hypothetical protein VEV15_09915, partial [Flavisolibacter sp.]|nr:hypothetical protein [Flavisolibacter sp.]